MEKNKIDKLKQQSSQDKNTSLSPQSKDEKKTVETYNYPKENIQTVLQLLNKLEIKGIENIKTLASISYILEQPVDEGISQVDPS